MYTYPVGTYVHISVCEWIKGTPVHCVCGSMAVWALVWGVGTGWARLRTSCSSSLTVSTTPWPMWVWAGASRCECGPGPHGEGSGVDAGPFTVMWIQYLMKPDAPWPMDTETLNSRTYTNTNTTTTHTNTYTQTREHIHTHTHLSKAHSGVGLAPSWKAQAFGARPIYSRSCRSRMSNTRKPSSPFIWADLRRQSRGEASRKDKRLQLPSHLAPRLGESCSHTHTHTQPLPLQRKSIAGLFLRVTWLHCRRLIGGRAWGDCCHAVMW